MDNQYVNINEFMKNYDNKNEECIYNSSDDIYYNDFISNYEEVQKNVKYCKWKCKRGYFMCRDNPINTCVHVFYVNSKM